jgi:hypothetical protein
MKAIIIHADTRTETVEFGGGCETIRDAVSGLIEAAHSGTDMTIWCNDEGKLEALPINPAATSLWWKVNPAMVDQDVIVGPALVAGAAALIDPGSRCRDTSDSSRC